MTVSATALPPTGGPRVWRRTRTGYQVVEALQLPATATRPETWRVLRHPGRDRLRRALPEPTALAEIGRLAVAGATIAVADFRDGPDGPVEEFDVPSPLSVALMHHQLHERTRADLLSPLSQIWAQVNARPAPDGLAAPAGALRVAGWLAGDGRPRSADRLQRRLSRVAGGRRLGELTAWVDEFARPTRRRLLLGGVGTGSAYLGAGAEGTTFLVGSELAAGLPEWDVGFVLGELLERVCTGDPARSGLGGDPAAVTLLAGRGPELDLACVARASVLRWLVHLHDYAAYVGWSEELADRLDQVVGYVDDPARSLGPA